MFEKLVQKIDPQSKLLGAWTLTGGISAQITALEIERADGSTQKMIVRRHGDVDFNLNPRVAADEFQLMRILKNAGVAAPAPIFVDDSGEIFDRPVIVVEFVDGKTEFAPANLDDYFRQIATHLARIHRVDPANLEFLPQRVLARLEKLDDWRDAERILEAAPPQVNPSGLLHGDFWPGNMLWRDGQLAAIIDWEDAALGDPLVDVANIRLETLWALGVEAMDNFTRRYQAANAIDFTRLPYWDISLALRHAPHLGGWGLDAITEKNMCEKLHLFVERAVNTIRR